MRKAVIYTRVSTDEQKENGFSLQDQEIRLRKECQKKGYIILDHYQDDHSAKTFNRPAFKRFQNDLVNKKIKPDIFLCVRYDRFSRNVEDHLTMKKWLKSFNVVLETLEQKHDLSIPENLISYFLEIAIPQVDNERKGLNTKSAMRQAMRQGRWLGKAPLGYYNDKVNKTILVDPDGALIVKRIFETFVTGCYSAEQIRRELKEEGIKIRSKQNFLNLLRNPVYIGKYFIKAWDEKGEPEEFVTGIHEPLISEELFYEVQDILAGKKKRLSRLNTRKDNLPLRGFLQCRICNKRLTGSNSKSRNGSLHSYYHCQHGCKERFRADIANEIFTGFLKEFEIPEEAKDLYSLVLADVFKENNADRTREKKRLENDIDVIDKRIENLSDSYFDRTIDERTYRENKSRYEKQKNELVTKHFSLQPEGAALSEYLKFSFCLSKGLSKFYNTANFEIKQQIVGSIFDQNLVFEGNNYRTNNVNEAFELIRRIGKALPSTENKKVGKNTDLSCLAPPSGLEPETL